MALRRFFLLLVLVLAHDITAVNAAITSLAGGAPVQVEADQFWFEGETNTYRALGDVHIRGKDLLLEAQEVSWQAEGGDAIANGQVKLSRPATTLMGDFLRYNFATGEGEVLNGKALLEEERFHFAGERIVRTGDRDFRVEQGSFTSCDPDDPDWRFVASSLEIHNGRWATARNVRFHVADIPVFYLPYFIYPIRYERESGFLEPEIGYSSRKGNRVALVYYWAIARNMDATFTLDYLSKIGLGKGAEYRYAFSRENNGAFKAYHVNGYRESQDNYALGWEHDGWLPGKVRMLVDAEYVSRREFLEDFGSAAEEYNQDLTESTLAFTRAWQSAYAGARFDYTQDLETKDPTLLQQLPRLDLSWVRTRIGNSPLFFAVDSSSTYFWRKEGQRGTRMLLRPLAGADLHLGRYVSFEPEIAYLQRYYDTVEPEAEDDTSGNYEVALRFKSELSRVFALEGETVEGVRHVVEPRLEYLYRPDEDQARLPQFDFRDRLEAENIVELSLVNRLTARLRQESGDPYYHEFLNLRLSQGFDLEEQRRELAPGDERRRPWTPLRSELIVRPTRRSYFDVDASFDVNSGASAPDRRTLQLDSRAGIASESGDRLELGYYYNPEVEKYLAARLATAWFDPLHFDLLQRYDFREHRNLERGVRTEYRSECWSVALTVTSRPGEMSYMLSFALGSFGKLTEIGGGI